MLEWIENITTYSSSQIELLNRLLFARAGECVFKSMD